MTASPRASLKDLVVHVDGASEAQERVDVACRLARSHDAHLAAVHVTPVYRVPVGIPPLPALPEMLEQFRRSMSELAAGVQAMVQHRSQIAGVTIEWRTREGEAADIVKVHARYADLAIVGQPLGGEIDSLAAAVCLGAGRPVLVVPRYGTFVTIGERVLVAWDAGREACRAVNDALPLLRMAKQVVVMSVNAGESPGLAPGDDIALHLARHGISVATSSERATDIDVANLLLSRAADLSADPIVMGAYGHSRLRELVLGGVTRRILEEMTLPVLMSH
jgi:nucleotide-binding universal stress UspA family protein